MKQATNKKGAQSDKRFVRLREQPTGKPVTMEESREAMANLVGFFRLLAEWNRPRESKEEGDDKRMEI